MPLVTYFAAPPRADELPVRLPSPFADRPHPLARRAADELMAELRGGLGARLGLDQPGGGKMVGVLVVEDGAGRVGYLRAVSGMVGGRWVVDGFAPPLFDLAARDAFWPDGERELAAIVTRIGELELRAGPSRAALVELAARHAAESSELRERLRANRRRRHVARAGLADPAARHALDQESRADAAERRRFDTAHRARKAELARAGCDEECAELERLRAARSRDLLHRIHATYVVANARGERRALRELFAPDEPPGGAGDCAAPKLVALAYREQLRPIALAELWWGAPPEAGGRRAGEYYPACRGKCGPVLAHMLDGLPVDPAPVFGAAPIAADEPRTVYEDDWLVVVAKPEGLLSVPGRSGLLRDSVLTRLRARHPGASVVHRLDLDTSGLLLAAKDAITHAALQRLFAQREIDKRYVAWLDGDVACDGGVVELALRVDLDDRPRQIHDSRHGKPAVTEWRVVERAAGRTRVVMVPRTGRAHQLRVHAAHAAGLGAPIVGDRLYGRPDARMMLHAEALSFVHPHTRQRVVVERPAPF